MFRHSYTYRRETDIFKKEYAIFCRLIRLHPTSSVSMPMIHRKKKDSEGGNDGGHLDNEGGKGRMGSEANYDDSKKFYNNYILSKLKNKLCGMYHNIPHRI